MTAHEQTLAELTAKICEAVPDVLVEELAHYQGPDAPYITEPIYRDITLEDVLRAVDKAIEKSGQAISFGIDERGRMHYGAYAAKTWTLGKPLHEQSPKTIEFLSSLLA
jgi:hypothetical protein